MDRDFITVQKRLAQRVKAYRAEAELSQEALALEADVDRTYVSKIERAIGNPSLRTVHKLAAILGVSLADLIA